MSFLGTLMWGIYGALSVHNNISNEVEKEKSREIAVKNKQPFYFKWDKMYLTSTNEEVCMEYGTEVYIPSSGKMEKRKILRSIKTKKIVYIFPSYIEEMKTKDEIKYKERKEKAITEGKRYVYVGCFGDYTYEDLKNSKFFNLGNKKETIKIFGKPREGQYDFYKCFTDKNGTCLKDENGKETYEEITEQEYNDILMLIRC